MLGMTTLSHLLRPFWGIEVIKLRIFCLPLRLFRVTTVYNNGDGFGAGNISMSNCYLYLSCLECGHKISFNSWENGISL